MRILESCLLPLLLLREIEPLLVDTYDTNTWKSRKGRELQVFEASLSCSVRPVLREKKEKKIDI